MALASLKYKKADDFNSLNDSNSGVPQYDGSAAGFHEWEFRALTKAAATEEKDRPSLAAKIVDSLRGDAMLVAMEFGRTRLLAKTGVEDLVEELRARIFHMKQAEARELFRQGQRPRGPLSRSPQESTVQFIARRRRW